MAKIVSIYTKEEIERIVREQVENRTSTLEKQVDKLRQRLNDLETIQNG